MSPKNNKKEFLWEWQSNIIEFKLLCLFAFLLLFSLQNTKAEGSVDFINYDGNRLFYWAESYQQLKVYATSGEFINLAASHVGISGGSMSIYRPDGSLHTIYDDTGGTQGLAIINNNIEELNGPTGGGTTLGLGYVPGVVEVQPGEEGVWTVLMEYPMYNNVGFPNLKNSDAWTRNIDQPTNRRVVLAWDITVSQGNPGNNDGNLIDGRVYSNQYMSMISQNGNTSSPTFYILTEDGFQYQIDFNEVDPWGFPIHCNSWGILTNNDGLQPTYKSFNQNEVVVSDDPDSWTTDQLYLYEPQAKDLDQVVNNKIFFNRPNPDLPLSAIVTDVAGPGRSSGNTTHLTWLYVEPPLISLELNEINLIGIAEDGTPLPEEVLSPSFGANINYTTNIGGTIILKLDLNQDGIFGNDIDRIVYQRTYPGSGSIFWDGLDKSGQTLTPGLNKTISFQLDITGGELHIMMADIENDLGGVAFTRLNGLNAPDKKFLYDHTAIGGPASNVSNPNIAEPTQTPFSFQENFGDENILDYWTYVGFATQESILVLDIVDDLSLLPDDSDGDGLRDDDDIDDDNDGIPDVYELCPETLDYTCTAIGIDPMGDEDFDGTSNYLDANDPAFSNNCLDNNGDGICDEFDSEYDLDGDNIPNHLDLDSDNDGITDLYEANHLMLDLNGDGVIDGPLDQFGKNGLFNALSVNPDSRFASINYEISDADEDMVFDVYDLDSDNDGIHDVAEANYGSLDLNNNGILEFGESNIFFDEKGVASFLSFIINQESIPDPLDMDLDEIANFRDLDSDADGLGDVLEGGNEDPEGDGTLDFGPIVVNAFGLAILNANGQNINTSSFPRDSDNDTYPDHVDHDSDNDGIFDVSETDLNDDNNDGFVGSGVVESDENGLIITINNFPFSYAPAYDKDGDGIPNYLDYDSDNDGVNDVSEGGNEDPEDDGVIGFFNPNVNHIGVPIGDVNGNTFTSTSFPRSTDSDGIPDYLDHDSDNDGINDVSEGGNEDPDDDGFLNSGTPNINSFGQALNSLGEVIPVSNTNDKDNDGRQNYIDLDADNDGLNDIAEATFVDFDNDGEVGSFTPQTNDWGRVINNNVLISTSLSNDFDGDGLPDFLDLDSDNDGINDVAETDGWDPDNDGVLGVGIPVINADGRVLVFGTVVSNSFTTDTDDDGAPDYNDLDSDNDGIPDVTEADFIDEDFDGVVGTGTPVVNEDGQVVLIDQNGNVVPSTSNPTDTDDDGIPDYQDLDADNDNIDDEIECSNGVPCEDSDGDGIDDWRDTGCEYAIVRPNILVNNTSCDTDFIYLEVESSENYTIGFGGAPVGYNWINGNGVNFSFTNNSSTFLSVNDPLLVNPISVSVSILGCESEQAIPVSPIIYSGISSQATATAEEVCAGEEVQLFANTLTDASYTWTNMTTGQVISNQQNPIVQALNQTTVYGVSVNVPYCSSTLDDEVSVQVNPNPTLNSITGGGTYCEGEQIILSGFSSANISSSLTYTWEGPEAMFTNTVNANEPFEFIIENANLSNIGEYNLQVFSEESCYSEIRKVEINIIEMAETPNISTINPNVCEGEELILSTTASLKDGEVFNWYLNGTLITSTQSNNLSISNTSSLDAGSYSVEIESQFCSTVSSDELFVNIINTNYQPEISTSNGENICEGEGTTLAISNPFDDTSYTWFGPSGNVIGNGVNIELTNLVLGDAGTYSVEGNVNDCAVITSNTIINIVQELEAPTLQINSSVICEGNDAIISLSNDSGVNNAIYNWFDEDGNLIQQTNSPSLEIQNANLNNTGSYSLVIQIGDCSSEESIPVSLNVISFPSENAFAGTDQSTCGFAAFNLNAAPPISGTGMWTSPTATIINPSSPTSQATNLTQGPNLFVWTLSTVECGVYSTDSVWVMYTTPPNETANVIQNAMNICETTPVNISASLPTVSSGVWTQVSGPTTAVIDNAFDSNTTVRDLFAGQYVFRWTLSFANCGAFSSDELVITVDDLPSEGANAGFDRTICSDGSEITLNALNPLQGTGMWTSTTATILEPNNPNSEVTNLADGENVFTWVLSNGSCTNYSADQVVIEYLSLPTEEAQVLQTSYSICESSADGFVLEAIAPMTSTGTWQQTGGPNTVQIMNPSSSSTSVQGMESGEYIFEWSLSYASCGVYDQASLSITVDEIPSIEAETGSDFTVCGDEQINLNAIMPSIGNGVWTSADATILNPNEASTVVENLQLGTNTFYWSLSNGNCQDYSVDELVITYLEEPSEQAEVLRSEIEVCEDESSSVELLAVVPSEASGSWKQISGPTSVEIVNSDQATSLINGLTVGSYEFEWSLSFGECGVYSQSSVTVIVTDIPDGVTAQAGMDYAHCGSNVVNLNAILPNVGSGMWSSTSSQIADASDPNTEVTLVEGLNTFTWSLSNGVCENYSTDELEITYTASPEGESTILTADEVMCESVLNNYMLRAEAVPGSTGMWVQESGPTGSTITDPSNIQTSVTGLVSGNYVFSWTLSSGSCLDYSSSQVSLQIDGIPSEEAVVMTQSLTVCSTAGMTISALAVIESEGMWTSPSGATILNPNSSETEVANLELGENLFVWTLSNGSCTDFSQDVMTITVEEDVEGMDDAYEMTSGTTLNDTNVLGNDELNGNEDWIINLVSGPTSGNLNLNTDGTFDYTAESDFTGTVSFVYEICNESCGTCSEAMVEIQVNREEMVDCKVPNILTPNEDQSNDYLEIACVSQHPENELCIFNRWGDQVYEKQGYQNEWNGEYEGRALPAGTYFYVFKRTKNDTETKTGYITIIR